MIGVSDIYSTMAYLSVTPRGSLFQNDKVSQKIQSWKKLSELKRVQRTEEYLNRHLRKSCLDDNEHVSINVGGTLFKTRKSTLRNVPETKLSNLDEKCSNYDSMLDEYFFDRNPFLFSYILDYYRTGTMHLPNKVCSNLIREELQFWDLGDGCISECCRKTYFDELDANTTFELIKAEFFSLPTFSDTDSTKSVTNMTNRSVTCSIADGGISNTCVLHKPDFHLRCTQINYVIVNSYYDKIHLQSTCSLKIFITILKRRTCLSLGMLNSWLHVAMLE